jgi:Uma2 family endonuclease
MSEMIGPSPERKLLMTTAPIYVHGDPWTIDDLHRLPDDIHAEIIDGSLIVSPSPTSWHQLAVTRLSRVLEDAAASDFEVVASSGVQVRVSYLEPDVAVVRTDAALANVQVFQPEDLLLVVEIVSPSNAGFDRREKPIRYGEAGIPHFWRVELEGDRSPYVVRYGLDDSGAKYVELGTVWAGDEETVDIGFPVTLRPAEFIQRRKPRR